MTITKRVNVISQIKTNVLDDDSEMNGVLAEVFKMNGLPLIKFYDNTDLFLSETDENVHLCLLDYYLEGELNGLDVARILKSKYPNVKIVFVTAYDDKKFLKELIRLKISGLVEKGLNYTSELVKVVQAELEEIRSNLELAQLLEEDYSLRKPK
jgi:two-component system, response regulator YesN